MITPLQFDQLARVRQLLALPLLDGLVAVLTSTQGDSSLFVYLSHPPQPLLPATLWVSLAAFMDWGFAELADYDGLTVAYPSLELLQPALPTKGLAFFPLDRLLREWGQVALLRRTWAELARFVQQLADERAALRPDLPSTRRLHSEATMLAAVQQVADLPAADRHGLVALLPGGYPLQVHELTTVSLPPLHEPVVTFEELCSETDKRANHFVDLRAIHRKGEIDIALDETLLALAHRSYQQAAAQGAPELRRQAYALALERHLRADEVDDLVIVLPSGDFDAFATEGRGLYFYRRAPEQWHGAHAPHRRRLSLEALNDVQPPLFPDGYGGVAFSFLPLKSRLRACGLPDTQWADLSPVLYRAGKKELIARNAWLLVYDCLEHPDHPLAATISLEDMLQTMRHSCALLSVEDPWRVRQGRRNQWLLNEYRTLVGVLDRLIAERAGPAQLRYRALREWYGCALPDTTIEEALKRIAELLRNFGHQGAPPLTGDRIIEDVRIGRLKHVADALLELIGGGGQVETIRTNFPDEFGPSPESVAQFMSRASEMMTPFIMPSLAFRDSFGDYAAIMENVQRTRASRIPVEEKIKRLTGAIRQLQGARRLVFAQYHQARILDLLYERAIEETRQRRAELEGGASLDIRLVTSSVAQHEDNALIISITNAGRVPAEPLRVELLGSDDYQLLDQSYRQSILRLLAGEERRCRFMIRPVVSREYFPVQLLVTYDDRTHTAQERTVEFNIRVTSLDRGPFRLKPNPYQFGAPLMHHERFYGRQKELTDLTNLLRSRDPQSVLLRGARRTGKTSILYMLQAILDDQDGRNGAREWFGVEPEWYPALDRTRAIVVNLQALSSGADSDRLTPSTFYKFLLTKLGEIGFGTPRTDALLRDPYISFSQFESALNHALKAQPELHPVLLVDEFDIVDQIRDKGFYGHLRTAIANIQGVTWIVASALGLYKQLRDYESPLFNVFKIIELSSLERGAAEQLVRMPWRQAGTSPGSDDPRVGLQFTDDAVETILDETGCYPYFIQMLCSEIVSHVNSVATNYVQEQSVFEVIEKVTEPRSAASEHFAYLWDSAQGMGKLLLLEILGQEGPVPPARLKEALLRHVREHGPHRSLAALSAEYDTHLERLGVVGSVRLDRSGRYTLGIPLFGRLLHHRSSREALWENALQELATEGHGRGGHDE